jgi:hypothetical protein
MKPDQDYIKKLLEAFEAAPHPTVNIHGLEKAGVDYRDKKFEFHMGLFCDKGLVERADGEPGFGLIRSMGGHTAWADVPLRLTAQGHDFLEAIRDKEVWATIKKEFKEASFGTLLEVAKRLLKEYTEQKLLALVGKL